MGDVSIGDVMSHDKQKIMHLAYIKRPIYSTITAFMYLCCWKISRMSCIFFIHPKIQQNRRDWELLNDSGNCWLFLWIMELSLGIKMCVPQLKQGCQTLQFFLQLHVTLSIITLIMNLASGVLISQRKWHIHQNKITAFMNDQSSISLTWLIMLYLCSFLSVEPISFAVISL